MLINRENLVNINIGLQTRFNKALAKAELIWKQMAMEVQSSGSAEEYHWLGDVPVMKQWIGDREFGGLRTYKQRIENVDYANGIAIKANDINDDRLGMVGPQVSTLATQAAFHAEKLVLDLLKNGFTGVCYDGQTFYDTDHKDGNGPTLSNKVTTVLSDTALRTAEKTMSELRDERGELLGIRPTHLFVPPALKATAEGIVKAQRLASGADNLLYQMVELVVSPRLGAAGGGSDTAWHLLDLSNDVKPLILQVREPVTFTAMDSPDDPNVFMRKEFQYGAQWRGGAGYALWQFAYGSTGAG